jgi:hypothetical protein
MMKFIISFLFGTLLLAPLTVHAQIFFKVTGRVVNNPNGTVTYQYTVYNNSWTNVAVLPGAGSVEIGRVAYGPLPEHKPQLTNLPPTLNASGEIVRYGESGVLSMTSPAGWAGHVSGDRMNGTHHTLMWKTTERSADDSPLGMLMPGQSMTMSVTRAEANPSYLGVPVAGTLYSRTRYWIGTNKGPVYGMVEPETVAPPTPADVSPPTLSVTLSPSTLKPNKKLTLITATITVTDNIDPAPEIKLESIVANEPLEMEDIKKDANIGTDDRQFKLKAEREGKNKAGRIYTVTYSATDGSGNKAIANATVMVPHDERKKDD